MTRRIIELVVVFAGTWALGQVVAASCASEIARYASQ